MTNPENTVSTKSRAMIQKIRGHIELHRNQYKDHAGALFFLNLCEVGPEHVMNFFLRFSAEGYNLQLNDVEVEALTKAGEATRLTHRLDNIAVTENVRGNVFNRRRLLLLGASGTGLALLASFPTLRDDFVRNEQRDIENIIDERTERVIAYATNEGGEIDEERLRRALAMDMRGADQSEEKSHLAKILPFMILAGVSVFVLSRIFSESYDESKAKMSSTLTDLDAFCEFRLNRTSIKAPSLEDNVGQQRS